MSGHSKWSTIKRKKESEDQKRGAIFTKLGRAITIAVRQGDSPDPETNFSLRLVIDQAKAANMPKENIKRAIDRGAGKGEGSGVELKEATYEGFGPQQIAIMVEVLTDNTNRTVAEIKKIFETRGGSLASPGSVAYLFEKIGFILIKKPLKVEEAILKIIDLGAEDVEETKDGVEVYVAVSQLASLREDLLKADFEVSQMEIAFQPKSLVTVSDEGHVQKILTLLETLNAHDDVQKVWANVDLKEV